jgi:hypothetical protein
VAKDHVSALNSVGFVERAGAQLMMWRALMTSPWSLSTTMAPLPSGAESFPAHLLSVRGIKVDGCSLAGILHDSFDLIRILISLADQGSLSWLRAGC